MGHSDPPEPHGEADSKGHKIQPPPREQADSGGERDESGGTHSPCISLLRAKADSSEARSMKQPLKFIPVIVAMLAGPALAQTPPASPLLGSWAVDVARLPVPPDARPKSVTMTFSDAGGGKWRTNVDILAGDGSERHMASTYTPAGTPQPNLGELKEADRSAVKLPEPGVMVLALTKGE